MSTVKIRFAYLKEETGREQFWGLQVGKKYIVTGIGYDENEDRIITLKGTGGVRFLTKNFKIKIKRIKSINKQTNKESKMANKSIKKVVKKKATKKVVKETKKVVKKTVAKKVTKKASKKADKEETKVRRPKSAEGLSLTQTVFKMLREKKHTDEMIGEVLTANFPDAKHNDAGIVKYHRAKHNRANQDDILVQMVEATVRGKVKLVEKGSHTPVEDAKPKKATKAKAKKEVEEKPTKKKVVKKVIKKKKVLKKKAK